MRNEKRSSGTWQNPSERVEKIPLRGGINSHPYGQQQLTTHRAGHLALPIGFFSSPFRVNLLRVNPSSASPSVSDQGSDTPGNKKCHPRGGILFTQIRFYALVGIFILCCLILNLKEDSGIRREEAAAFFTQLLFTKACKICCLSNRATRWYKERFCKPTSSFVPNFSESISEATTGSPPSIATSLLTSFSNSLMLPGQS